MPGWLSSLFQNLCKQKVSALSQAITLVENIHPKKKQDARMLMSWVVKELSERQKSSRDPISLRIGLTGPPGAGKSTFIESFGTHLTSKSHRVAVLAVDPSSTRTGGSIMADKTRMFKLSQNPLAYIRPSPTSGCLGGVTRTTADAILLCEAAGFDVVIVETVGVGQSEQAVAEMVDIMTLLIPPASGDELQGLKMGILEAADIILITKSDGNLAPECRRIAGDYKSALKIIRKSTDRCNWIPKVKTVSSRTGEGIDVYYSLLNEFKSFSLAQNTFNRRRASQRYLLTRRIAEDQLLEMFWRNELVVRQLKSMQSLVSESQLSPSNAADELLKSFVK